MAWDIDIIDIVDNVDIDIISTLDNSHLRGVAGCLLVPHANVLYPLLLGGHRHLQQDIALLSESDNTIGINSGTLATTVL